MRRLLVAYVALLAASFAWRALATSDAPVATRVERRVATIVAPSGEQVELAYRDSQSEAGDGTRGAGTEALDDATPIVLLHGSPGTADDFRTLLPALARSRRVLAPDLPGFGASTRDVPDYSIRAHAEYVLALLDALGVERAHVLGFSMGGGVAIELTGLAPERVASLMLLSAIGVQELELFGDHHLNHAVHGLQLGALFALRELVPHFGALDGGMLSREYARNFYDSDQRPLRARLEEWTGPTLVLHGEHDVLVPYAAALEHWRVVPQSELVTYDANHFIVFRGGGELALALEPFLAAVDEGRATTRATAEPERIARASEPYDPASVGPVSGFALALLLVLAALATLVSEDLTCIGVGALIGQGRLEFLPGVLACFVGIYVGDVLLFVAGRSVGRRALGKAPWKYFLTEERVERSSSWFRERGPAVIFLSRFLPGMRLPTYFAAGVLRTSFWRFSFWFALAAALWTPILVWLSGSLGGALSERAEFLRDSLALTLLATLAVGWVAVKFVRPLLSYRGRRLLVGSFRRLVRWEYWPRWAFYPPIVLACVGFALKRRRALAFTAANPAMPHAGVVGESKGDILEGLAASEAGRRHVARTLVLPPSADGAAREREARAFLERAELDLPVVVKPDVGQRGDGVRVVRSWEALSDALRATPAGLLVQEFVEGPEFGLFYARVPGEDGRLISIARKVLPTVRGDGVRSVERLVLEDDRAVCMARTFLATHVDRLDEVVPDGEVVPLGELGTHCRGAAFLEGGDLRTGELERAVDELSRGYDGFYFGRYDVRAASEEALTAGHFRVLELNGVTSESAHVYDPRYSVWVGWRTLASQWDLAFRIGTVNVERGARASTIRDLLRSFRRYRAIAAGKTPSPIDGASGARQHAREVPLPHPT